MGAVIDRKPYKRQDAMPVSSDARQHIITCAARLFRERGYAAVSLRDVASETGATTGSLYHHFASKDELVQELLDQAHQQILREVQESLNTPTAKASPRAILLAALTAHLNCLLAPDSLPAANIRIFAHVPETLRHATLRGRRNYEKFWINLLGKFASERLVRSDVEPKALVMVLFGAMNLSLEWFKPGRDQPKTLAEDLIRLIEAA